MLGKAPAGQEEGWAEAIAWQERATDPVAKASLSPGVRLNYLVTLSELTADTGRQLALLRREPPGVGPRSHPPVIRNASGAALGVRAAPCASLTGETPVLRDGVRLAVHSDW